MSTDKLKYGKRQTKIVFYDLETTGVKHWKNCIHQLSGLVDIDGEIVETFNLRMSPHPMAQIDPQALAVSKVTEEEIRKGMSQQLAHVAFTKMLSKYVDKYNKQDKFFLCGYNNMGFDDKFLRKFFELNDDPYFGSWFWANSLDVMCLATAKLMDTRHSMPDFKLHTVAESIGLTVEEDKLHDAIYDVELTRNIYYLIDML